MDDEKMDSHNDYAEEKRNDPRTNEELIRIALTHDDEDIVWDAIVILHIRGTQEIFETASKLCESDNPKERACGVDILAQLGTPEKPFRKETTDILLNLLNQEEDTNVLYCIGVALGHLDDPRAIEPLSRLKKHADSDVRYGVIFGLLGHEDELAIKTLIELSEDEETENRDWATFGIGSQIDADTPEVRNALLKRLADTDGETREEALCGLARRKDERVIEPLIKELSSDEVGMPAIEAAIEMADPRLYSALVKLKQWCCDDS